MRCKRSSRISRLFAYLKFRVFFTEKDFFNTHAIYRQPCFEHAKREYEARSWPSEPATFPCATSFPAERHMISPTYPKTTFIGRPPTLPRIVAPRLGMSAGAAKGWGHFESRLTARPKFTESRLIFSSLFNFSRELFFPENAEPAYSKSLVSS